ncbi:metal-binding protein, partial [filamentous cyanobacterium CCP5]
MPSGRTHDRITLWTLPLVFWIALWTTLDGWLTAIACLAYLFGGLMFGPDLDIHSVQYKRWGLLRWIWLPYRGSMRHRSWFSHGPVIGTTVRVIYFFIWVSLFGIVIIDVLNGSGRTALTWRALYDQMIWGVTQYWPMGLTLLLGLEAGA